MKQKADRHLAANKVLAKALHILKSNSAASEARAESELADLRTQLAQSEDRAKVAEHTVNVLRWHLQHGGSSGLNTSMSSLPDVF